jgi:aconitate hydratase
VLAESYERIHRSNLIGMGVLPLQFQPGQDRKSLALDGSETIDLAGQQTPLQPGQDVRLVIRRADGRRQEITTLCRIDTVNEVGYYQNGGILNYVLRRLV